MTAKAGLQQYYNIGHSLNSDSTLASDTFVRMCTTELYHGGISYGVAASM